MPSDFRADKNNYSLQKALYKQPEVLVLDEATSSPLDSSPKSFVQKTTNKLRIESKSIVLISHRLSTVVNADRIVVLKKGKVIEQGSHNKFYDKKGAYYKLWQQQIPQSEPMIN